MSNKSKTKIWILVGLIIILIVGVILFLLLQGSKNKELDSKQYESTYRMSGNSLENFDLSLLKIENKNENKIYSPLSIKYALNMLSEGAVGSSKLQIDGLIGEYNSKKYVNSENMSFANALFVKDSFKNSIKKDYVNNLSNKYNAEVIYDSFKSPNVLNDWVSNKTFGLINNLYDDISDSDFLLTNALAIDMEWKELIQSVVSENSSGYRWYNVKYKNEKFSKFISPIQNDKYPTVKFNNDTINAKAVEIGAALNNYDIVTTLGEENIRATVGAEYKKWLANGGCGNDPDVNTFLDTYIADLNSNYKQVDTSTDFLLYDDNEVKAFAKDLKEYNGITLQYVGIMPKNVSLDTYISTITSEKVNNVINNLKEIKSENFKEGVITNITGLIPLFKFEYEWDLIDKLKKLGITDIFDSNKANLSGITSGAVINKVSHKANIEFSNEGIKAAAVTTEGGWGATGCKFTYEYDVPVETIDLTFNNPYLFLIRDKNSGEIWFIGTVYNPTVNQ